MHLGRRKPQPGVSIAIAGGAKAGPANALVASASSEEREMREAARSLTASGMRITRRNAETLRRLVQFWQSRALAYYDQIGEIKYASQFYSRSLSTLRLYAAKKVDGEWEEIDQGNATGDDLKAIEALDRVQDPGGGTSGLLASYGRLMFLTGEAILFVSKDEDGEEQWEMLSTDELRVVGDTYMRFKAPSLQAEDYKNPPDSDDEESAFEAINKDDRMAVAYRFWKRHPRYSMLADSPMYGILDLCEELVLLTQAVRARARSRMAGSGFLFIDDRISPAPPQPVGDENPAQDVFMDRITTAMTSPIVDEGSASAVVPILIRVPVPEGIGLSVKDMVAHLQVIDPTQLYPETGLRMELIQRMAIGLDMPPEELLGKGDANHWTGWLVDEQSWKVHLQPIADLFVGDMSSNYFRPELKALAVKEPKLYAIRYDASAVINHPDRTKDAKDLHGMGVLSDESLRDAGGFTDDDAPSEAERDWWLGVKVRDGSLAKFGIPQVKAGIEPEAGEIESPAGSVDAATDGDSANAVTKGPPEGDGAEQPPPENVIGAANGQLSYRIMGAADLAVLRAREAAGARLRSFAKRNEEASAKIEGVRTGKIAFALGPDLARKIGAPTERELVASARILIADALRMWGIADEVAVRIIALVEQHAARTLYEENPSPLPLQFKNYIHGITTS